jgi:Glycosyl transferases group 1
MQYAKRKGVSPLNMPGHVAIGYAVDVPSVITWEERSSARQTLGIDQNAFVVLRLLRPDLRKWDPLPVLAVHRLIQEMLPIHLVVRSVPKVRERWVKKNCGSSLTLLEPTEMSSDIRLTLAAADCLVNCSQIGETFGLGLAEAMAVGLPVIVNSTPRMDNAQIELCRHESNGLVANTVTALTNALRYLFERRDYALDLGREGRRFIDSTFATPVVERRVRRFLIERLKAGGTNLADGIPAVDRQDVVYKLDQLWLDEYWGRLSQEYKPSQTLFTEAIDLQTLSWLRLSDNVAYALDIGPRAIVQSVIRRMKSGSLFRE